MELSERLMEQKRHPLQLAWSYVMFRSEVADEVAQLEAELAAHKENEGDECPLCACEEEHDALVELLKEYGDHHWTCQSTHGTGLPCDCTYGAALDRYATQKEIEDER